MSEATQCHGACIERSILWILKPEHFIYYHIAQSKQHGKAGSTARRGIPKCLVLRMAVVAQVMEKPWFQNRKCLDIGCNEGMVTLALASHFGTISMLGIDIDKSLIGKASRRASHLLVTSEHHRCNAASFVDLGTHHVLPVPAVAEAVRLRTLESHPSSNRLPEC